MDEEQVTALAREYAEEMCGKEHESPMYFNIEKSGMEEKLRWLLRRFCLVEKSRIQEEYQKAQTQIKDGKELGLHVLVTLGGAKEALLESLFPEFAKEGEG